jgi:hypothetical protein
MPEELVLRSADRCLSCRHARLRMLAGTQRPLRSAAQTQSGTPTQAAPHHLRTSGAAAAAHATDQRHTRIKHAAQARGIR